MLAGAGVTVLAGYVMPAILISLVVTGFALGWRKGLYTLAGVAVFVGLLAAIPGFNRTEILQAPGDLRISAEEARYIDAYQGVRHLKKYWGEQQAALNGFKNSNPLLGVGAGGYQEQISTSYDRLSEVDAQKLEPGAQNGYLVTLVSTGLFGLAALLLLYGSYTGLAWRSVRAGKGGPWAAAMLGVMVALCLVSLATYPWVRGLSLVLSAWLAAIMNTATAADPPRMDTVETETKEDEPCTEPSGAS